MEMSKSWQSQAKRLKPFDEELIPVKSYGCRIEGSVKDHKLTVEDVLAEPDLKAIELRTSVEIICLDFDCRVLQCLHSFILNVI